MELNEITPLAQSQLPPGTVAVVPVASSSSSSSSSFLPWSGSSLVPSFLGGASVWVTLRDRLTVWAQEHPFLTLALMVLETRRQATEWRILARSNDVTVKDVNSFSIFQWAGVCERLSMAAPGRNDSSVLVLYWQMFMMLFFERNMQGRPFAPELLHRHDVHLVSRLAASLERVSAATGSPVLNAFSLWLRFSGAPGVLIDTWANLPAVFCGHLALQRLAKGARCWIKIWRCGSI